MRAAWGRMKTPEQNPAVKYGADTKAYVLVQRTRAYAFCDAEKKHSDPCGDTKERKSKWQQTKSR